MGRRHVWDSCFSRASDSMAVFSERGKRDQWHFDPHLHPRLGWPGLQGACLPPPRAETPRFQLPGASARAPVWTPLGFTDIPRGPGKVIELPPPPPRAVGSGRKRSLCFACTRLVFLLRRQTVAHRQGQPGALLLRTQARQAGGTVPSLAPRGPGTRPCQSQPGEAPVPLGRSRSPWAFSSRLLSKPRIVPEDYGVCLCLVTGAGERECDLK